MADHQTRLREPKQSAEDAFAALSEKFDRFVDQYGDQMRSAGHSVSESTADGQRQAKALAKRGFDAAERRAEDGAERLGRRIRRNPIPSVLIALGVGLLIGRLS